SKAATLARHPQELDTMWEWNAATMLSLIRLRELTIEGAQPLAQRVCAYTGAYFFGAAHLKMVVASDGDDTVAYLGGMDLVATRYADDLHKNGFWHDLQLKVQGKAVQPLYDLYRLLWVDQVVLSTPTVFLLGRSGKPATEVPAVAPGTSIIPDRSVASKA